MARPARKCQGCDRWFVLYDTERPNRLYCSLACANAAAQRRWRARQRKATANLRALLEGFTKADDGGAEAWGYHEIDYSTEWREGFETAMNLIATQARLALQPRAR